MPMKQINNIPQSRLKWVLYLLLTLTICMGVGNVIYIWQQPDSTFNTIFFSAIQYIVILVLLALPALLKRWFGWHIPQVVTLTFASFAFTAMVLGDGLNFYGRFPWWDTVLHTISGAVLAFVGLWLLSAMVGNNQAVMDNRLFVTMFVLLFGLACGAMWEICEYSYDEFGGTNTQQYMATTEASITGVKDMPLCGHEALRDTMHDTILNLVGGLLAAAYVYCRFDRVMAFYQSLTDNTINHS